MEKRGQKETDPKIFGDLTKITTREVVGLPTSKCSILVCPWPLLVVNVLKMHQKP